MIRVFRQAAPDGHEGRAQAALAELTSAAQRNGGTPSRSDLQATYKDPDVRETLWRMQHGKCAYCEREIEVAWEPVEHYRPFATYWWLAYSWQNLLLACNSCNSAGKSDRFPLVLKVPKPGERIEGASPKRRPGHEFGRRRVGCDSKILAPKPTSHAALRVCVRCADPPLTAAQGHAIGTKSANSEGRAKDARVALAWGSRG